MWKYLAIFVVFCILFRSVVEAFSENVRFLTPSEICKFIKLDDDGYYASFSKEDLSARHVASVEQYKNIVCGELKPVSKQYQQVIETKCQLVDRVLKKDFPDIASLPWQLAIVGPNCENGHPHTREKIIFCDAEVSPKVLLHEKVHVFQRQFPHHPYVQDFIRKHNYKVVSSMDRKGLKQRYGKLRVNCDLDDILYEKEGRVCGAFYSSESPRAIADISGGGQADEHPFEDMAYSMENLVK